MHRNTFNLCKFMSTNRVNDHNSLRYKERENEVVDGNRDEQKFVGADAVVTADSINMCPVCGAQNEPDAFFCECCGARLRNLTCPKCGAPMDREADYCERCHTYVDTAHCPFCHGIVGEGDTFCPDCGAPLAGIECPVCHSLSHFGFCGKCGNPLTDRARVDIQEAWEHQPYAEKMHELEDRLEKLWMMRPLETERQMEEVNRVQELCQRVKDLMAQEGETYGKDEDDSAEQNALKPMSADELNLNIQNTKEALQALLDTMEMAAAKNPALARNYAMARKPRVSRLAWKCNYKHALHLSPLGCACPQMGGKWVILDGKTEVVED